MFAAYLYLCKQGKRNSPRDYWHEAEGLPPFPAAAQGIARAGLSERNLKNKDPRRSLTKKPQSAEPQSVQRYAPKPPEGKVVQYWRAP